ncbi:hypothetical protein SAMN05443287_101662 [Micromonospora phaseoli]|uniref:O-antigen ligase n=1 Tax=Micromonospora phaseoli TaxID=1144548 RepID=A0A1H6SD67_9ACTN|nr:hypothetical protein [Micromonospora phaseoli]PZW03910.1 hypothetical protein CLV64_101662 [Micromonospora phaseoli]GIJ77675.1 hypothetical protein Xph01_21070 [Micromonospora phaseoli]SEI65871.1 hypothetical protein SAMN05443287_101662 [Micromonospora phaseoli]
MDSGVGFAWDIALAGAIALFTLSLLHIPATATVSISVLLLLSSSTSFDPGDNAGLSAAVRIASVLLLARFMWSSVAAQVRAEEVSVLDRCNRFVGVLAAAIFAYLAYATLGHGMYLEPLLYGAGVLLAVVYGKTLAQRIAGPDLRNGILLALLVAVLGSVALGLVGAGDSIIGDRLRGIAGNPNLLGFYTILVLALLLSYRRLGLWMLPLGAVTIAALVWSGSRAALVAAVLVVTMNFALRQSPLRTLWILLGATTLVLALINPDWMTGIDLPIFRTNNSRQSSYEYTLQVLADTRWHGVGFKAEATEVASTPLRALTHAGLVGGAAVLMMYAVILYYSAKIGRRTLVFGGAMVVHSLFEGWLLSPVGPMTMCFVATWCALAKCEARSSTPGQEARSPVPVSEEHLHVVT